MKYTFHLVYNINQIECVAGWALYFTFLCRFPVLSLSDNFDMVFIYIKLGYLYSALVLSSVPKIFIFEAFQTLSISLFHTSEAHTKWTPINLFLFVYKCRNKILQFRFG